VLRSLLAMVLISLAACHTAILSPVGPVGEGNRIVLLDSLAIMLAIVVPTIVAILAFAYWFRASNTWCHSTGSGCSFIRSKTSRASTAWLFRQGYHLT